MAVTSRIRKFEPTVTYNDTLIVYATALGFQGFFMLVGGISERLLGLKTTVLIGGYTLSLGVYLASRAESLYSLIFFYGFMFSVGMGMAYAPPIVNCVKWMPERKGLVTGVVVAGFGCSAFVFGGLAMQVLNPTKMNVDDSGYFPPDSSVVENVPSMFRLLGCVYATFFTVAAFLLEEPPIQVEETSHVTNSKNEIIDFSNEKIELSDVDTRSLMCNSLAWQLSICYVTTLAGGMYLAGTYKTYGQQYFKNQESYLSILGDVASIFNGVGRIVLGNIADSLGVMDTLIAIAFFFSIVLWCYPLVCVYENNIAYGTLIFFNFFFVGGNFALYLPLTIQLFGSKNASGNYGAVVMVYCSLNALDILFISRLSPPLTATCILLGLLCFSGFLNLNYLSYRIKRMQERNSSELI